jgi:uncharacterized membrane protein (DUF373 family)
VAQVETSAVAKHLNGPDSIVRLLMTIIEYAIVVSLLFVAGDVLVRSLVDFSRSHTTLAQSVITAVDGILVVIILLDIAQTVFGNLRSFTFPVRPFIVIGILAGVRDILSASAHLTLNTDMTSSEFRDTLISLGVGVGVVTFLLLGLLILRFAQHRDDGRLSHSARRQPSREH